MLPCTFLANVLKRCNYKNKKQAYSYSDLSRESCSGSSRKSHILGSDQRFKSNIICIVSVFCFVLFNDSLVTRGNPELTKNYSWTALNPRRHTREFYLAILKPTVELKRMSPQNRVNFSVKLFSGMASPNCQ